jgi:hypothetical protein
MKPQHFVTFTSDTGLTVKVLLGATSANLTGGFGGWNVVTRPKRVSLTRYDGKDPFRMDVPIQFDGTTTRQGQEAGITTLSRMAVAPSDLQQPPTIKVAGAVPRKDLTWVVESIDWDNSSVIWDEQGGVPVRLRQAATVHLLQYVSDNVIFTQATPTKVTPPSKVKDGAGKSAKQHAQDEYGNPDLWNQIFGANPFLTTDPRAPIPAGTTITIPPQTTSPSPGKFQIGNFPTPGSKLPWLP